MKVNGFAKLLFLRNVRNLVGSTKGNEHTRMTTLQKVIGYARGKWQEAAD